MSSSVDCLSFVPDRLSSLDDVGFGTVRAWNMIPFRYSEETSFHLTEVLENVIALLIGGNL